MRRRHKRGLREEGKEGGKGGSSVVMLGRGKEGFHKWRQVSYGKT